MGFLSRIGSRLRRLVKNKSGSVAVEFALIVPFAMALYAGGSYTAAVSTLNKKMQSTSYALINTVPYPRTVCSFRTFVQDMFSSGEQIALAGQLLAPFPVTFDNTRIRFVETPTDADGKFRVRVRIDHTPDSGPLRALLGLWSAFGGPNDGGTIFAESARVTITQDIPVCPIADLSIAFSPNAAVTHFEVLNGSAYNNTVTAAGGVKFQNKYRPYAVANLPAGLNFDAATGKFGTSINVACNTVSNARCAPVTLPMTRFSVQDYRDFLYDSAPASATVDGQFVVYYPVSGSLTASSGSIYQGQVLDPSFQPRPNVIGGWAVSGATTGYLYTATSLPAGLTMNSQTANITGTTGVAPGVRTVRIRATDARGAFVEWNYSLEVKARPLSVAASSNPFVATVGQWVQVAVNGTGGSGTLTMTCSNLPAGLTCRTANAVAQPTGSQTVGWIEGTPSTAVQGQNITVVLRDVYSNQASTTVSVTVNYPPVNHWFEGWIHGSYAGDYFVGYTGFSGGSGAGMSVTGCWPPPGMSCGSDGWRVWFAGNPSPGSGNATIQFRDNATGLLYAQVAWYSFGSRPINVWYSSHWGDLYNGGAVAVQYAANGGYGGYGYDCYDYTWQESDYLQCYAAIGQWDTGNRTSCISVWDGYGQSRQACAGLWFAARPIGVWFNSGFSPWFCSMGCFMQAGFSTSGGVGSRYVAGYDSSPWVTNPATHAWDGVNGVLRTWYASPGPTTIGVIITDDVGQAARAAAGY